MGVLSRFTGGDGSGFLFWCPGCEEPHAIRVDGTPPIWSFSGSEEKPTFGPSILVRTGHYAPNNPPECWCTYNEAHQDNPAPFHCSICHCFVIDGRIQFLTDSTHQLAGQTVDLPPWKGFDNEQ